MHKHLTGSVSHSPVLPWLLDLAEAQQAAAQPAAAVASLQKALEYMALPQQQQEGGAGGGNAPPQQQQQQQQGAASILPSSSQSSSQSSSSSSGGSVDSGGASGDEDALTAVLGASGGDMELARLKLSAMVGTKGKRRGVCGGEGGGGAGGESDVMSSVYVE